MVLEPPGGCAAGTGAHPRAQAWPDCVEHGASDRVEACGARVGDGLERGLHIRLRHAPLRLHAGVARARNRQRDDRLEEVEAAGGDGDGEHLDRVLQRIELREQLVVGRFAVLAHPPRRADRRDDRLDVARREWARRRRGGAIARRLRHAIPVRCSAAAISRQRRMPTSRVSAVRSASSSAGSVSSSSASARQPSSNAIAASISSTTSKRGGTPASIGNPRAGAARTRAAW